MINIYKKIYLVIFYLVNRYMSSALVERSSFVIFGYSKVAITAFLFKIIGIKLGYLFFVFIFLLIFDFIVILRGTDYSRDNVEYFFNKLEYKKTYIIFLVVYLVVSVLCAINVVRSIPN